MLRQLGPTEMLVILGVVLLLFGGKKLPDLARGSGQALRIFKTEVKSLSDGEEGAAPSVTDEIVPPKQTPREA